jgi:DNA repair exonuclease SbcCD ATPase subunit
VKLLAATVRNYRTHIDTKVKFDGTMVLVHGPNESGKSTLAEAIHCALFLKAKGNTNLHKAMQSDHGGTPEVELSFEANGNKHSLRKTFGASGNTVLESEGQATLNDAAAEECLARLLGVDGSVSGGGIEAKMERRSAHLWVWQGKSNRSPLDSIEESESQLRSKLQARSGQSFLSSTVDNAVIDSLTAWENQNFTSTGKLKTGSDLDRAEKALAEAETLRQEANRQLQELELAASAFEQAESDIDRHGKNLIDAEAQLKAIGEQLKAVSHLREQLKEKSRLREE